MIFKIFTIYDDKAKAYIAPFVLPEDGMAIRTFAECANSLEHQFGKHPEDYTLFRIGTFCDTNANINLETTPTSLGKAIEYKQLEPPQPDLFTPTETEIQKHIEQAGTNSD